MRQLFIYFSNTVIILFWQMCSDLPAHMILASYKEIAQPITKDSQTSIPKAPTTMFSTGIKIVSIYIYIFVLLAIN